MRSDRRYRFDAGPEEVWDAIAAVDRYRDWWPWLRDFRADALAAGDEWACVVQPPLPYVLRFTVLLDDVEAPARVTARVAGEIQGTATLDVRAVDGGATEVRLVSELAPASSFLQAVAFVARPVVRFGHDWVLDTGARQFRGRAFGD